jgi:hypothetical protein
MCFYLIKRNFMSQIRPDPHPLDYDWRFSENSIEKILSRLPEHGNVLAIGAPSIYRGIAQRSQKITLVDRQLFPDNNKHLVIDANSSNMIEGDFDYSFIDPPWYPEETMRWLSLCAVSIKDKGKIFLSIWPNATRPNAINEKNKIFDWIDTWGNYEVTPEFFEYKTPKFELETVGFNERSETIDLRHGDLVVINKLSTPDILPPLSKDNLWHRFVIGTYQLAVRISDNDGIPCIEKHELAKGWLWSSVSKRQEGRADISLWDSNNRVAKISGSREILQEVRVALGLCCSRDNNPRTTEMIVKLFKEWKVPSVKAEGIREWHHLD